jgi:hypothetical protein
MDALQEALDELYRAPLDEFVEKRNGLVRRLRVEGDKDLAEAVRGLAKPSVAAWAVNQLAFTQPDEISALMEAGDRLRRVQEWLLRREADPHDLRAAVEGERAAVGRLTGAARELLEATGRRAGPAVLERVAETLHAAAGDDEVRDMVVRGRLVEDRAAIGIGGLSALSIGPRPTPSREHSVAAERTRSAEAEAERRAAEIRRELEQAEAASRAATARRNATDRELERARTAAVAAEAALADAEAALDLARGQLADAERNATAARTEAATAESQVEDLRRRAEGEPGA